MSFLSLFSEAGWVHVRQQGWLGWQSVRKPVEELPD